MLSDVSVWISSSCRTWTQRDGWSWEVELVKNSLAEFRNFWILDQFWINTAAAVQIVTDCRNKTFTTLILQLWMEFFVKFYQIHCGWKYVWNQRRRWEVSSSKQTDLTQDPRGPGPSYNQSNWVEKCIVLLAGLYTSMSSTQEDQKKPLSSSSEDLFGFY